MRPPNYSVCQIAALSLWVLAGCESGPTRIYTLYAIKPERPAEVYADAPVRIDAVRIPPSLDRLELTTAVSQGQLMIHDSEHWSGPLGQLAQVALSLDLAGRLPSGSVIAPHLDKPEGAKGLIVDIEEFGDDGQSARLTACWTVRDSGGSDHLRGPVAVQTGSRPASEAGRLSVLLSQLADHIAADLVGSETR